MSLPKTTFAKITTLEPAAAPTAVAPTAAAPTAVAPPAAVLTAELPPVEIVTILVGARENIAAAHLAVPLVLAQEPDDDTRIIHSLFGLDTVEIVHGGKGYHVLADRVSEAISGINAELKTGTPVQVAIPTVHAPPTSRKSIRACVRCTTPSASSSLTCASAERLRQLC